MNKLDYQIHVIQDAVKEFNLKMEEIVNKKVEIKINEILKENYIVNPKKEKTEETKKYQDEVRGKKVFKRLEEMGFKHKDMMLFKEAKIPLYAISKILNLGEKTVRGYYKNYPEGEK